MFKNGTATLGTVKLNTSEKATLSLKTLPVGTDSLVAQYLGSTALAPSKSTTLSHAVKAAATATSITESAATILLGQTVKVTVKTVDLSPSSGTPSGTASLNDGKTPLGTQPLNTQGIFSGNTPILFTGAHALSANYSGSTQCKPSASPTITLNVKLPTLTTASDGLQSATVSAGAGRGAVAGDSLHVNYTGFLQDGTVFDSSLNAGRTPFDFTLGQGQVIPGWDQGMVGIKVGETRVLVIPSALGYGATGQGSIPPNATLTFVVQLVSFNVAKLVVTGVNNTLIANAEAPTTANGTNFGTVSQGSSSATETFTITNAGSLPLNFTASPFIQLTGTDAADFTLTQPVIANNAATFTIVFKPTTKALRTATITIPTNDPTYPNFNFTIEGTGN